MFYRTSHKSYSWSTVQVRWGVKKKRGPVTKKKNSRPNDLQGPPSGNPVASVNKLPPKRQEPKKPAFCCPPTRTLTTILLAFQTPPRTLWSPPRPGDPLGHPREPSPNQVGGRPPRDVHQVTRPPGNLVGGRPPTDPPPNLNGGRPPRDPHRVPRPPSRRRLPPWLPPANPVRGPRQRDLLGYPVRGPPPCCLWPENQVKGPLPTNTVGRR